MVTISRTQGFTEDVFNNLLVAAGAVILNPPNDEEATLLAAVRNPDPFVTTNGEKLGATTGGITFNANPNFENLGDDIDGLNVALRGSMVSENVEVTLETEVVEFIPGRLKRVQALLDAVTVYSDAVKASTTRGVTNAGRTITADAQGVSGNSITYGETATGNNATLAVSVSGTAITVALATDATGVVTSTANQVIAAINGYAAAASLVTASLPGTSNGTGVVAVSASSALTGGTAGVTPSGTDYVPRANLLDSDHIDKIAFLIQGKNKPIRFAVIMYNVLVTSGLELQSQSSLSEKISQGVTFTAMAGASNFDAGSGTYPPPYYIRDFTTAA